MSTSGAGIPAPDEGQAGGEGVQVPEQQQPGQGFDFEQGYNELRPKFTQTAQELAEARERASQYEALFEVLQDPESPEAQEILAELGYEMDIGDDEPATYEPDTDEWADPLEQEVKQLKELADFIMAEREQEAQSAQEAELLGLRDEYIDDAIAYINAQPDTPDLNADEQEILGNLAIAMADEEGVPDVQGAYNRLYGEEGLLETNRERWISTKNGALPAPLGHSGSSEKRPTNRRERVAYLDGRMRALDAEQ